MLEPLLDPASQDDGRETPFVINLHSLTSRDATKPTAASKLPFLLIPSTIQALYVEKI